MIEIVDVYGRKYYMTTADWSRNCLYLPLSKRDGSQMYTKPIKNENRAMLHPLSVSKLRVI